jgi:hypothetical protein
MCWYMCGYMCGYTSRLVHHVGWFMGTCEWVHVDGTLYVGLVHVCGLVRVGVWVVGIGICTFIYAGYTVSWWFMGRCICRLVDVVGWYMWVNGYYMVHEHGT